MTDDDDVGYKKPPRLTRFEKGRSGNPKGRPKGTKNLKTDLQEELGELILIREGNVQKHLSKQRGIVKSQMAKALKGDTRAASLILGMIYRLLEVNAVEDADELTPDECTILDDFEAEVLRKNRGNPQKPPARPRKRLLLDEKNPPAKPRKRLR